MHIDLGTSTTVELMGHVSTLFGDLSGVITLMIGISLALYIITKMIEMLGGGGSNNPNYDPDWVDDDPYDQAYYKKKINFKGLSGDMLEYAHHDADGWIDEGQYDEAYSVIQGYKAQQEFARRGMSEETGHDFDHFEQDFSFGKKRLRSNKAYYNP